MCVTLIDGFRAASQGVTIDAKNCDKERERDRRESEEKMCESTQDVERTTKG